MAVPWMQSSRPLATAQRAMPHDSLRPRPTDPAELIEFPVRSTADAYPYARIRAEEHEPEWFCVCGAHAAAGRQRRVAQTCRTVRTCPQKVPIVYSRRPTSMAPQLCMPSKREAMPSKPWPGIAALNTSGSHHT